MLDNEIASWQEHTQLFEGSDFYDDMCNQES